MTKQAEGTGVDPNDLPLMWEAYCKHDRWVRLYVERDLTLGLNKTGEVDLYLPSDLKKYQITDEQGTHTKAIASAADIIRRHEQADTGIRSCH